MSRVKMSWWLGGGVGLLVAYVLAPVVFTGPSFRLAMGDVIPTVLLAAASIVCAKNSYDSCGHTRLFWSLVSAGMGMWCFNEACWAWFDVVAQQSVPNPNPADMVLFLHGIPIMAAVAIRPHQADEREGILPSALNVIILLVWWIVVYAFFVFPDEYLSGELSGYPIRRDILYVVEEVILIAVSATAFFRSSGVWRGIYRNIFLASVLYSVSLEAMYVFVVRGTYQPGGVYDLPFLTSLLWFLWVGISGRNALQETETTPSHAASNRPLAAVLAQLALFSLPVMGYWALFLGKDQPYLRHVRFNVAMGGVAILAFVVLLKQHLLDRKLLNLLNDSRQSFDNLQRLQGRVIQQAKLASLGELVALAAGELEFPLSAILNSSEKMAASSNLSREQLSNAQKIGQQARRTRELVSDLLSFAQQTPGEKSPLELRPLLQRAIQMEGFKLENRKISLTVESRDPLPRVVGNANQLLQAFLQIIENAVDALQEIGGGRLQVSLWRENNEVVVQFADSGPGLRDPERVFDPFYTTKPVGKGTGLGLSATYGVVQDHRGQIICFNRPEGGAAFEIRLPMLKVPSTIADAAPV